MTGISSSHGSSSAESELLEEQFQTLLETLEVPENIDPHLLSLWIQREQDEIERKKQKYVKPPQQHGLNLTRLFAAYIGVAVMCISIVLGLIQQQDSVTILKTTCIVFLFYSIIGAFIGMIAERCVNDSVESLLRDVVNRSRHTDEQKGEDELGKTAIP